MEKFQAVLLQKQKQKVTVNSDEYVFGLWTIITMDSLKLEWGSEFTKFRYLKNVNLGQFLKNELF